MENGTMMQSFHWYTEADGNFWKDIVARAEEWARLGINSVWLPPAYKGSVGSFSQGYDTYDLFDLGEFDQKGSVRTKYGTKDEYLKAIEALHAKKIQAYADIVLNHKGGADEAEKIKVMRVNPENRNEFISDPFFIEAFTKFTFPGRNKKYSDFIWDYKCFSGVDYASDLKENGIFSIMNEYGSDWEEVIDDEKGNYDFLMYADIDFRNPAVREELNKWGKWYLETTGMDGVRLDAVKHMPARFYNEWLDYMRTLKPDLFAVGEYWAPGQLELLVRYIDATQGRMSLFDAALHHNLRNASIGGKDYDLCTILDNSLVKVNPALAVTVVDNHDTQPLQSLEAPVEAWFKPLAYALIFLRQEGYPCLFWPDLYGAHYVDKGRDGQDHEIFLDKCAHIEKLLMARNKFAYGQQRDYFDLSNCIGWTREGVEDKEDAGCAVLLSNGDEGFKSMEVGKKFAGKVFVDYLENHPGEVTVNGDGWGEFHVSPGSISVWIQKGK
jgi:alpha-amylase